MLNTKSKQKELNGAKYSKGQIQGYLGTTHSEIIFKIVCYHKRVYRFKIEENKE